MKFLKYAIPLILAFLGFLIYSNVLHGPFMFDDEWFIRENYKIRDISNFLKDFSGTRHIGFLTFAANYYFGGLNTFGYHLVNIIIHIINAILVYILIQLTIGVQESFTKPLDHSTPRILPFAVSLIFLVHPIQTQAVSYITQRFTSLATLFYLLALVLYIKARNVRCENCKSRENRNTSHFTFYILLLTSYLSTILAMKTKELSFTLPFIIIFYEFTFFNGNGQRIRTRFLYLLPFLLTLAIIPLDLFFMRANPSAERLLQDTLQKEMSTNPLSYASILTQFNVIITYIRLLFMPVNLHFYYDYPIPKSIFELKTLSSLIFLISAFGFAIYLYFRSQKINNIYGILVSYGIFWFLITLSIAFPLSGVIFEHWLYLPSIGFILAITTAVLYGFNYLEKELKDLFIITLF